MRKRDTEIEKRDRDKVRKRDTEIEKEIETK